MRRALEAQLKNAIYEADMTCGDLVELLSHPVIEAVQEIETERGIEFTAEEIRRAWRAATEEAVDEFILNAEQTFDPHFDSAAEIKKWESRRPRNIRRAQLEKQLQEQARKESDAAASV
jgi:hypothetical protein